MEVVKRGHIYKLDHRDGPNRTEIHFVNKEPGHEEEGVTTQEILRMLIDRTHYCHSCTPHDVNERIIHHFRMALVLHEARALEQKVRKGQLKPEFVNLSPADGHFNVLEKLSRNSLESRELLPVPPEGEQLCNHRSGEGTD